MAKLLTISTVVLIISCVICVIGVGCGKNAPVVQTEMCTQEQSSDCLESPPTNIPETTPWNLAELYESPDFRWLDHSVSGVKSLLYEGPDYKGNPTEVFAYYCSPKTLGISEDDVFPGIVLVHGGYGYAMCEWARMWALRGYAAIAMDLDACGPDNGQANVVRSDIPVEVYEALRGFAVGCCVVGLYRRQNNPVLKGCVLDG